jgi:aryl-alcohol dehydrogenase-like predicted oxidoreductase
MQYARLGRSGLTISRIGLGMMSYGDPQAVSWYLDRDGAEPLVRQAVEAGVTFFDTADMYSDGASEAITGQLLPKLFARREDYVLATKVYYPTGDGPNDRGLSRAHIMAAVDASLRRLGTDHVDLWQIHGYDPATPLEETLAAFDHAVASGRVRYVGVSNFAGWQTARAATWQLAFPGRAPVVAAQVEYSLLERAVEREVLPACADLGLGVLPWSPLGRGVLTGKYRHGRPADSRAASPVFQRFVSRYFDPRCSRIVEAVVTAAAGLGVAPLEVALAWVRDRPGVVAPILGARTVGQLLGALQVEQMTLTPEITQALDDVSAVPIGYPERDG